MEPIACLVFYLVVKMWEVLAWKIFTEICIKPGWLTAVKTSLRRFLDEYTHFLNSSPFLKKGNEISKKFCMGYQFFKKAARVIKREELGKKMQKS